MHVFRIGKIEVLHLDGACNLGSEGLKQGGPGRLVVNRPQRVEVPIVVVPERIGRMRTPGWLACDHGGRFIQRRMIDARAGLQEVDDAGLFFFCSQGRWVVVDAKFSERARGIDTAVGNRYAVESAEKTLANGMNNELPVGLTPFGNDDAVVDDYDCRGIDGARIVFGSFQLLR